jgi:hypothetical protein
MRRSGSPRTYTSQQSPSCSRRWVGGGVAGGGLEGCWVVPQGFSERCGDVIGHA